MKNLGLLIKKRNYRSEKFIKLLLLKTHLKQKNQLHVFNFRHRNHRFT